MKSSFVKLPLYLYCRHGIKFYVMKIEAMDPEVPSYAAKCPKCGKEVIFDFDGGVAES
ncbi:hypothetical protein KEJ15_09705 [Candidatus Bathyarchaeota archaeon]|nr:hypothetical protein [Candidatus Bathyarchaeota archaeon]